MSKFDTLDALFQHGVETAKMLFDKSGSISPMWIAVCEDGSIIPIVTQMEDKDDTVAVIKQLFKDREVVRYVSLLEAWALVLGKDAKIPESMERGGSIASHPERREIIWVTAEDRHGNTKVGQYFILRPEHGKPTLSPFKEMDGDRSEGRFANLLAA